MTPGSIVSFEARRADVLIASQEVAGRQLDDDEGHDGDAR